MLVLDASIALAVMLPDEASAAASLAMDLATRSGAVVPIHWPIEIANGLLIAQRRNRITSEFRQAVLRELDKMPVELDEQTIDFAWTATSDLAIRHNLTIYDAAYLELASRKRMPLATLDSRLSAAAQKEGVSIFGKP